MVTWGLFFVRQALLTISTICSVRRVVVSVSLVVVVSVELVSTPDSGGKPDKLPNEVVHVGVECRKVEMGGIHKESET